MHPNSQNNAREDDFHQDQEPLPQPGSNLGARVGFRTRRLGSGATGQNRRIQYWLPGLQEMDAVIPDEADGAALQPEAP